MGRGHETEIYFLFLAVIAWGWSVDKHPYQPYQCSNTDYCINNVAGQCCRAKQKCDQVKTKDSNQAPVQSTDKRQWYKNIVR